MKTLFRYGFPAAMALLFAVSAIVVYSSLRVEAATQGQAALQNTIQAQLDPAAAETHGRDLFIAKGCIVCHRHDRAVSTRVTGSTPLVLLDAPNLTDLKVERDYLRRWLENPSAIKPTTEMPNLHLDEQEIEALVAFLTAGQ